MLIPQNMCAQVTVEMGKEGDVYTLNGKVNGLPLKFIFDTGASNVSLSLTEAVFMIKNGFLKKEDIRGVSYAQIANGDIVENTEVLLRTIEISGIKIYNVKALISHNLSAPLLLGQSAIQKLGPIKLDGNRLIIENGENFKSEKQAWNLYQKAYQAAENGNITSSIAFSEQALKCSNDNELRALLYDNIAFCYHKQKNYEKGIECLNLALSENIMAEQPAYNLGVYLYEFGEYEKSERALKHYLYRHTDTHNKNLKAAAYAYLGDTQRKLGKLKEAEENYKNSLNTKPYSQPYFGLGDLYFQNRNYSKAAENYEEGIKYEPGRPSNVKRYFLIGLAYTFSNEQEKAYNSFKSCKDCFTANGEIIKAAMNDEDKSIKESAIEFIQRAMEAELWMGRTTNNPYTALSHYKSIIDIAPINKELTARDYVQMSMAYNKLGNSQQAKEVLYKGGDLFPDDVDIMFFKSSLMDYTDEKIDLLKTILTYEFKVKPSYFDWGTIYNNLAWSYCCMKKYSEGLPFAEQAIERNPEHGYSWETIGELYFYTGKYDQCIEAMTKCLECQDGNKYTKDVYKFRGESYLKLGKKKEGKKELQAAETIK